MFVCLFFLNEMLIDLMQIDFYMLYRNNGFSSLIVMKIIMQIMLIILKIGF